jgi:hypothetical protein
VKTGGRDGDALVGSFYKRHAVTRVRARKGTNWLGLRLLVGAGFQGLFHPPLGVLFTFPSRYSFPIGRQRYLALEGGPPRFPPDSSCPVVLRVPDMPEPVASAYGALTPCGAPSQVLRLRDRLTPLSSGPADDSRPPPEHQALQPPAAPSRKGIARLGLGCTRFARHYSGHLA